MAKTFEQVKKEFFNTRVITNNRLPKRGESHKIAVKLGLIDQKQSTYVKKQKLSYVGLSVIECFEEAGLDDGVCLDSRIRLFNKAFDLSHSLDDVIEIIDKRRQDPLVRNEPYRVCRRLNILRDYSDEKTKLYPRN
ncbi:helix-turn-helix domain-containing protein [Acinetobacter johnsonii]|uniref:hypothetical protein n=1 Tax=Acinetobacter johnsonii TaxID=40214 RepID=UPI00398C96DA